MAPGSRLQSPFGRLAAVCAVLMLASACATPPTLYSPAMRANGIGWSEYPIEPGRYRVTFRGGPGAPMQQVADYALLRAADLTLAQGYDWFRVADRVAGSGGNSGARLSLGLGSGSYGRHGGVSLGVGRSFDLSGGPALVQTLEIVMGRGAAPRDPDVYDARALRRNLGAHVGDAV